ncbi:MAG: transposase [bacterium]
MDLYKISSGKHKGERHITKRVRSLLRKLLYFASLNMAKKINRRNKNASRAISDPTFKF